ncbi:hypothetical protein VPH35_042579 [Triticum aestivum]
MTQMAAVGVSSPLLLLLSLLLRAATSEATTFYITNGCPTPYGRRLCRLVAACSSTQASPGPSTRATATPRACGRTRAAPSTAMAPGPARRATAAACSPAKPMAGRPTPSRSFGSAASAARISSTSPLSRASTCPWTTCRCRPRAGQGAARGRVAEPT